MGSRNSDFDIKIKPLFYMIVSGEARTGEVNRLVFICHRMAIRYITMKIKTPSWNHIQMESINDLAWDSIAEIFRKDENDRFADLIEYFKSVDFETATEGQLYSATRRLVFSKVNDSLFRFMRDYDPSLSKIIRNVKKAVKENREISLIRKWNTSFLNFYNTQRVAISLNGWMPPEILNIKLLPYLTSNENIPEIISQIQEIITYQDEYVHVYPLVPLCMIIRESHILIQDPFPNSSIMSTNLVQNEVARIISSSINSLKAGMRVRYVQTGKIDEQTFNYYFDGIRDYYLDIYVFYIEGIPYFTYMKKYLPQLTYSSYRSRHRKYVEYLMKLSREHIQQRLMKAI